MKKSNPKNQPISEDKDHKNNQPLKMSSTNQVILAAIVVLLIFSAAVMSSTPKQTQTKSEGKQQNEAVTKLSGTETRSGQQVARISITRSNGGQANASLDNTFGLTFSDVTSDVTTAISAGARVKFKISTFKKLAVQPLKFNIYDDNGQELTPDFLQTVHEAKLHLFVLSANLREFGHFVPEYKNGIWNANVSLPNPGTYYAYVEICPVKGGHAILRSELTVRSPSKEPVDYPGITPNNLAVSDDITAALNFTDTGLNNVSTLMFSLTKGGQNVSEVKPYLGAFGQVTIIKHNDLLTLVDAHPLPINDQSKGIFEFGARFLKAGRYTAFAEFKVGSKVHIFPFTFDVQ